MFFSYPWNNFLHTQVEQSIKSVLVNIKSTSPLTTPEPADAEFPAKGQETAVLLADDLLDSAQLVKRLLDVWAEAETNVAEKHPRLGYMGHIIKIANHVVDSSQEEALKRKLEGLPTELGDAWTLFVSTKLTEINKRIQTPLVNEMPSNTFEEDVTRQENALHQVCQFLPEQDYLFYFTVHSLLTKAFVEYQMQQMTRNLCTQIGFNTTEFTELDDVPIQ